jgi:hypothetical protein
MPEASPSLDGLPDSLPDSLISPTSVLPSGPWQNLGIPWEKALIFTTSW